MYSLNRRIGISIKHWEEFWKETIKPPLVSNPPADLYGGTNYEPDASIGMSCFLEPVRDKFKEGFRVLDYGCGAGILANFISERLNDFQYWGLEPDTGWGPLRIEFGKKFYNDPRVHLGFIEADYDRIIKEKLDCIVLISIFTHLPIESTKTILQKLYQAFEYNPGLSIVFSCFIENAPGLGGLLSHIGPDYHGVSNITYPQLLEAVGEEENGVKLEKAMNFIAMGGFNHHIYKITKEV